MDTGFDFTKQSLYQTSGNGSNDKTFVSTCASEILNFINKKHRELEDFDSFKKIPTKSCLQSINDDLAAIEYLCIEIRKLEVFFKAKSDLHGIFVKAKDDAEKTLISATRIVEDVRKNINHTA